MSYLEEVFKRAEHRFDNKEDMIRWLDNFNSKGTYTEDAHKARDDIIKSNFLLEQSDKLDTSDWTTADELRDLRNDADDLELIKLRADTINEIQSKLNIVESLEGQQIELQEQAIAEREALKQEIVEARTREDLKQAEKALAEVSPQSLGGIRSGETRRVPKAFATIFE